ncbi:MAG: hypothetical protein QF872_08395 [Gammaproteobacteria bacterium]|nr:hypothetical protein [Gammaproteobacteria bacterium]
MQASSVPKNWAFSLPVVPIGCVEFNCFKKSKDFYFIGLLKLGGAGGVWILRNKKAT